MKKYSMFKVLMITLLLVAVATWFLPITSISTASQTAEFVTQDSIKLGLFTVFTNLSIAFQYFCSTMIYVVAIGGLYGVLHRIPQYRMLLDKIVRGFDNKEWLFMIIVGIVFALLSSMAGLSIPLLVLFPFVIAVILLMGYDKITAAMLTVGSVIAGLIGSVYSANDVYGITRVLGVAADEKVEWKIILLCISLVLVLVNVILYSRKHQDKERLVKGFFIPEPVDETKFTKKNIWPMVVVLDVMLVVIALGFISWNLFDVSLFSNAVEEFVTPIGPVFVKGLFGVLNTVLGVQMQDAQGYDTSYLFGSWTAIEATLVVVLATCLIAFIYKRKLNGFLKDYGNGAKKAFKTAGLLALAYTILISVTNSPFELSILRSIIDLNSGFSLLTMCVLAILCSLFTTEIYYSITAVASYIAVVATAENLSIIALIWQSMFGLTMLIAPTSIVLIAALSYLDIPYTKWLKAIWKLLLELFAVILVLLLIFK